MKLAKALKLKNKKLKEYKSTLMKVIQHNSYDVDNKPIPSNYRSYANEIFSHPEVQKKHPWYGLEQEYIIYDRDTDKPIGWKGGEETIEQGFNYCSRT